MSEWKRRRFWKDAAILPEGDGHSVRLDGRPVRTPAKAPLILPTPALAHAVAAEWQAQGEDVLPDTMPLTRAANAAIDKVSPQHAEVAQMIAEYGDSDLLCYRAETPAELADRQAAAWDPLLDWAESALDARLIPVAGVMHKPQPERTLDALRARVHALDPWALTAFHDLVSLSGSLVLGFATMLDHLDPAEAWEVSRIDETWQEQLWGRDDEAHEHATRKQTDFFNAARFYNLSRPADQTGKDA